MHTIYACVDSHATTHAAVDGAIRAARTLTAPARAAASPLLAALPIALATAGHARIRQFIVGGTTMSLLRASAVPVLVLR